MYLHFENNKTKSCTGKDRATRKKKLIKQDNKNIFSVTSKKSKKLILSNSIPLKKNLLAIHSNIKLH